jgi:ribosome-associated toxin RatA of RatAB toxin-antitoxin module
MFALVNGFEAYPEFLPWCRSARVISREDDEVRAMLELAWHGIQKSFITCNRMQKDKLIHIRLVKGPFRCLEGFWRFQGLGEQACKISLDMQFEFATWLLSMVIGPVFSQISNSLVDAFIRRAVQVYGKR